MATTRQGAAVDSAHMSACAARRSSTHPTHLHHQVPRRERFQIVQHTLRLLGSVEQRWLVTCRARLCLFPRNPPRVVSASHTGAQTPRGLSVPVDKQGAFRMTTCLAVSLLERNPISWGMPPDEISKRGPGVCRLRSSRGRWSSQGCASQHTQHEQP